MQSLRTRRLSTQDNPNERRQPQPVGSSDSRRSRGQPQRQQTIREDDYEQGQGQARPRPNPSTVPREMRKSRVDDRIRRRMSTWYTDGDNAQQQGSIPDVPALPKDRGGGGDPRARPGGRDTRVSARDIVREDPRAVDVDILQQDDFDPDAYLRLKLSNSTEAELKALQASLIASKSATSADLQYSIFKNYEEFILISKEISTLENAMLELKESLSEWKSMPSLLRIEDGTSQSQERKRAQRSSVADLRVLYASQMQELHSKIEGSTKFVPAIPGRHVIYQSPELYHLNQATYKVEYAAVLVLLDDSVLVAKRRRRRNGERGRLVAERCWNLSEIVIVDVKDTANRTNIIKVRHGREGYVYRTDRSSEKKSLLAAFRQTSEELATKRRKEREGEHERRMSVWTAGERSSMGMSMGMSRISMSGLSMIMPGGEAIPPMPGMDAASWANEMRRYDLLGGSAKEKAEGDLRWISEFCDNLTVAIALREWDEAVKLVEEGRKQVTTKPALKDRLQILTSSLISALLHSLSDHRRRKTAVVQLSGYLARLHSTPAARSAFLAARGELIRKRVRTIPLEGDIALYIFDLAIIVFTAIKHTAEWYLASFKENESASYFVQWCKEQMEAYCVMFRKQLESTDDPLILQECLDITRTQSKRLLMDNGLDFTFILADLTNSLPPYPPSSLEQQQGAGNGTGSVRAPLPGRAQAGPPGSSGGGGGSGVARVTTPRTPFDGGSSSGGGSGPGVGRRPVPPRSLNRPPSFANSPTMGR
ncbi:exocyst complex component exo84 [Serendipita sp. 401]|nr:exocyst complex component exo84 [Serendipita sp. 401]KAG9056432.1 exocyst complex component exo84 [Serendipita sp. 407]